MWPPEDTPEHETCTSFCDRIHLCCPYVEWVWWRQQLIVGSSCAHDRMACPSSNYIWDGVDFDSTQCDGQLSRHVHIFSCIGNCPERGDPDPECDIYAQRFLEGYLGNSNEYDRGEQGNAGNHVEYARSRVCGNGSEQHAIECDSERRRHICLLACREYGDERTRNTNALRHVHADR